jgi:hypothetical protein
MISTTLEVCLLSISLMYFRILISTRACVLYYDLLKFVIEGLKYLPERAFAQQVFNFIPISNMVMIENLHLAFLVVENVAVL